MILKDERVNVNKSDFYDNTPLNLACINGHDKIAQLLINSNANVNLDDEEGRTPLYNACDRDHLEVVKVLLTTLDKGAKRLNLNIKGKYSYETAFDRACSKGHSDIVSLLLETLNYTDIKKTSGFEVREQKRICSIAYGKLQWSFGCCQGTLEYS